MANTFIAIATTTVGSGGTASITFSSIPQTYTDLLLKVSARSNNTSGYYSTLTMTFNGTNTYSNIIAFGTGSGVGSGTDTAIKPFVQAATTTANVFGQNEFYIPNYTSSNAKSVSMEMVTENNATDSLALIGVGLSSGTSAISTITLSVGTDLLVQYSTATLYGIKN